MSYHKVLKLPAKVLLLVPPQDDNLFSYSAPYLGLGYIGASLEAQGHSVKIFDCSSDSNYAKTLSSLMNSYQPAVVGITGFSFQYLKMIKLAAELKTNNPEIIIVLGGSHVTALAANIMAHAPYVDFCIRGEGEAAFNELCKALSGSAGFETVSGLVYRRGNNIIENPVRQIQDIDELEYPWKILNPLHYQKGQVHGFMARQLPVTQVISSRGCPYMCTFCAGRTVLGSKIRMRAPSKFVDELEYLKNKFGIREVQIIDYNFTFNRDHAMQVCQDIIRRNLNISWSLPNGVRADRIDKELLLLMKKAGCYSMAFGIEFGSERILKIVKKSLDLKKAREAVSLANKLGFITQGFFLMGYPQETIEDLEATAFFVNTSPFDKVLIGIPFPYPGTELFEYYIRNRFGSLDNIDWTKFRVVDNKLILEHLLEKDVRKFKRNTYLLFYLNPLNMIRFFSKFRSVMQFKTSWEGFKVLLKTATGRQ